MRAAASMGLAGLLFAGQALAGTPLPVHIGGRVEAAADGGYSYDWVGTYFEARFKGPRLVLGFDDPSNIFALYVDGKPVRRIDRPGETTIVLEDLGRGEHTARLERLTEVEPLMQRPTGRFIGFTVPKAKHALPAPTPRPRRIEFIGDSSTTGYGVTSTKRECTQEEVWATTDAQQSYGARTAKHFDADYQLNAWSGRGIIRNYGGREPDAVLPKVYPFGLFDLATPYADPDWKPQIVVFSIFGNDFSPLAEDEPWKTTEEITRDFGPAFVAFMRSVRQRYPEAFLVFMVPEPSAMNDYRALVQAADVGRADLVLATDEGESIDSTGCHWHASQRDTQLAADKLNAYIEAHPDLWGDAK